MRTRRSTNGEGYKDYIIYDQNETLCFIGPRSKACKFLDMSEESFKSECSRIKTGKIKQTNKGYTIVAIKKEKR